MALWIARELHNIIVILFHGSCRPERTGLCHLTPALVTVLLVPGSAKCEVTLKDTCRNLQSATLNLIEQTLETLISWKCLNTSNLHLRHIFLDWLVRCVG